jgi:hypothetical protein
MLIGRVLEERTLPGLLDCPIAKSVEYDMSGASSLTTDFKNAGEAAT